MSNSAFWRAEGAPTVHKEFPKLRPVLANAFFEAKFEFLLATNGGKNCQARRRRA